MFNHLLSLLIWLPVLGATPVLLAGSARPNLARWLSLLVAVLTFLVSLFLLVQYNPAGSSMQLVESHLWIASWGVHYGLAVDGISVALIVMTTFVGILVIAGAWEVIQDKPHQYMAAMLILEGLLIGVFCATDALLFYALFEAILIPMFILIGIWGGPRRVYATLKFFIYTFFGSVFMLIALLYLYQKAHTFDLATLAALPLTMKEQTWIFFAFLIAFAIKVPMVARWCWRR
jgi:NADH-quinone oxidoreductase subunit M